MIGDSGSDKHKQPNRAGKQNVSMCWKFNGDDCFENRLSNSDHCENGKKTANSLMFSFTFFPLLSFIRLLIYSTRFNTKRFMFINFMARKRERKRISIPEFEFDQNVIYGSFGGILEPKLREKESKQKEFRSIKVVSWLVGGIFKTFITHTHIFFPLDFLRCCSQFRMHRIESSTQYAYID